MMKISYHNVVITVAHDNYDEMTVNASSYQQRAHRHGQFALTPKTAWLDLKTGLFVTLRTKDKKYPFSSGRRKRAQEKSEGV
jgi:hypothetical protein